MKFLLALVLLGFASSFAFNQSAHIRLNQAGYLPADRKVAIAFSNSEIRGGFKIKEATTGRTVYTGRVRQASLPDWGPLFSDYFTLDLSWLKSRGRYTIELEDGSR